MEVQRNFFIPFKFYFVFFLVYFESFCVKHDISYHINFWRFTILCKKGKLLCDVPSKIQPLCEVTQTLGATSWIAYCAVFQWSLCLSALMLFYFLLSGILNQSPRSGRCFLRKIWTWMNLIIHQTSLCFFTCNFASKHLIQT